MPDHYFLNLSFLFGFASPGQTSYLTGGRSLGIEFVLYALFPVLLAFARDTRLMLATLLAFLVLRAAFLSFLLGHATLYDNWGLYTQPGAFLVFFFGGMIIAKIMPTVHLPASALFLLGLGCAAALFVYPGSSFEAVLLGARGLLLTVLSIAIVAAFFWSPSFKLGAVVSQFFGDISYGLYLMHPLVWAATKRYLPPMAAVEQIAVTIAIAASAAWLSLRFYERPIRTWIVRRVST